MTPSCAELGETCAATTVALGIVVFVSATYAAATFRPVMPILIWIGVAATRDATLAKCRCVEARAEKNVLYHSAGVVDTRHFAKIRVSQGDLRSKINRHVDEQVRDKVEGNTVGILLCKLRNRVVVEYALKNVNQPIAVSTYELEKMGLASPKTITDGLTRLLEK